jgi:hypothetical protein
VDKNVRKGLRHGSEYSAGLQPVNLIPNLTWGVAPGYDRAGLQPAAPPGSTRWDVAPCWYKAAPPALATAI